MKTKFAFVPVVPLNITSKLFKLDWKSRTPWCCSIPELIDAYKPCETMIPFKKPGDLDGHKDIRTLVYGFEGELYAGVPAAAHNLPDNPEFYFCLVHRDFIKCHVCGYEHEINSCRGAKP